MARKPTSDVDQTNESESPQVDPISNKPATYMKLEQRRVLNADFGLMGTVLDLNNFSEMADENLTIADTGTDITFTLSEGMWTGTDDVGNYSGNMDSTLTVSKSFLSGAGITDIALDAFGVPDLNAFITGGTDITDLSGLLTLETGGDITGGSLLANNVTFNADDICLTDASNDFMGTVTITAADEAEIVDANDLAVGDATTTSNLRLQAGAMGPGNLDLNGNLSSTQILLQASNGVDQMAMTSIGSTDLILDGDGIFDISQSGNAVSNLAADVTGSVLFTNSSTLDIADITYSSTDCGTMEAVCGVNVSDDLTLDITGDLTQSARVVVGDQAILDATGDIRLTGASCSVVANENDFVGTVDASGATVEIVDRNALLVGNITATNDIFLRSGDADGGGITLNGNLMTDPGGQVLLQSDSGVTQAMGSVITTTDLLLGGNDAAEGSGLFDLDGNNVVNNLAANIVDAGLIDGQLNFTNTIALTVADLNFMSVSVASEQIVGLSASEKVRLTTSGITSDITINEAITTGTTDGTETVFLISDDGVNQGANGQIVTNNLMLQGTGAFALTNTGNTATNLAADIDGDLSYTDVDTITMATLTCDGVTICGVETTGAFTVIATGLDQGTGKVEVGGLFTIDVGVGNVCLNGFDCDADTFNDNDFNQVNVISGTDVELVDMDGFEIVSATVFSQLRLYAGDVAPGLLTISGTLDAGEQILLQASNGVTQNAGVIMTPQLLLGGDLAAEGSGNFILNQANEVDLLASNLQDNLEFTNNRDIVLSDLSYLSSCGTSEAICGLNVGDDLTLDITGSITQTAPIVVGGNANLMATQQICLTGASCNVAINENDFMGTVDASATTVEIVDRNALTAGNITATNDIFLRSGNADGGGLTLNGNLMTDPGGQVLLQSDSGVSQAIGSVITTTDLLLGGDDAAEGAGLFDLNGNNVVNNLAANIVDDGLIAGQLNFTNTIALTIADLTYMSVCMTNEQIIGANVSQKVRVNTIGAASGITINEAITTNTGLGTETVFLNSGNGVTQGANGQVVTNNLMLQGTGVFTITNTSNNAANLAADITGDLNYFDADGFTVSRLVCDAVTVCGLDISNDLTITTINGDIFQDADAAVIVGGNTLIDTGSGDVCLTGGDCDGLAGNDNNFVGNLSVVSTGDVVIAVQGVLDVNSVSGSGSYWFSGTTIQINTNITATQLLLDASAGVELNGNTLTVTDLLLTGGGDFNLNTAANAITNLAANITAGNLTLANSIDLNIADLTFVSNCGNVNVCGVFVGGVLPAQGNLTLQMNNNNLSQSAAVVVQGLATFNSGTGNICLNFGDCGTGLNENDFNQVWIQSATDAEIVDRNDMTVVEAIVTDQLRLGAGADDGMGGFSLGQLTLDGSGIATGNLTAGSQILLQASNGVVQANGVISAPQLLLGGNEAFESSGDFTLDSINQVNQIAGNVNGDVSFTNGGSLEIASLDYNTTGMDGGTLTCNTREIICGLRTNDSVNGSDLSLNIDGNLTQAVDAAILVGGDALIDASGQICLTGGDCADLPGIGNDNDFDGVVNINTRGLQVIGTTVEIVDINSLTVNDIFATDDIFLESGNGTLSFGMVPSTLNINGLLAADAMGTQTGQVLLRSDGGITQNVASTIASTDLLLESTTDVNSTVADFNLLGANQVDFIAGNVGLDGETFAAAILDATNVGLAFNNARALTIASLTYDSACGTMAVFCGLDVDGDLALTVNGDLRQALDASIRVTGTSNLVSTDASDGVICLNGGDCDADTLNDNDFVGEVSASGFTVEIVDRNDLIVGQISAESRIRLWAGDVEDGQLTINNNLSTVSLGGATTQILLQASNGVQQVGGIITTDQLLLGASDDDMSTVDERQRRGDFNLAQANVVTALAARIDGNLTYTNDGTLIVSSLAYSSVCGTMEAICGIGIEPGALAGNLSLTVIDGDLQQAADAGVRVAGTSFLSIVDGADIDNIATGSICFTGGVCAPAFDSLLYTSNGVNDNDFVGEVTIAGGIDAEIVDQNELVIGSANVSDQLRFWAGQITDASLILNGNIDANQTLLQASDGIQQTAGVITTNELLIGGDDVRQRQGVFTLNGNNRADQIAARIDGDLFFTNDIDLRISDLTYGPSDCGTTQQICGIEIRQSGMLDGDLAITLNNANLSQALDPSNPTEAGSASVIVDGLTTLATGTGDICLTGGDCTTDATYVNENDFNQINIVSANDAEIFDRNDLVVTGAQVDSQLRLVAGTDGVIGQGLLTLAGNVTAQNAMPMDVGQVLLQASNGVTQTGGIITTDELFLGGDDVLERRGDFTLNQDNLVGGLAANVTNDLQFTNAQSLVIITSTFNSNCGIPEVICGVTVGEDLTLDITGDLTQSRMVGGMTETAAVVVMGETSLTATGAICLTGGDCDGMVGNDNNFVQQVTATGATVEIVAAFNLIVGDIIATNDIFLRSGGGEATFGSLTLMGNITTDPMGQVLLQSNAGLTQAGGIITTTDLLLGGDDVREAFGDFTLTAANLVTNLAADLADAGSTLTFNNAMDLNIGDLNYSSACGTMEPICGLNIGENLILSVTGNLDQTAAVVVSELATFDVTGNICLTFGDCNSDGINDNDFNQVWIINATNAEIFDRDNMTVVEATVTNNLALAAGTSVAGTLTLDSSGIASGNLTAANDVLLQASNGVVQVDGVIAADNLLLGGNDAAEGTGDFVLNSNNLVDRISGFLNDELFFTNVQDLEITSQMFDSACGTVELFDGLQVDSMTLDITGNLTDAVSDHNPVVITQVTNRATLTVSENIVLGDGADQLIFDQHDISQLQGSSVAMNGLEEVFVQATAENASFNVDSSIIFSDTNIAGTLFVQTGTGFDILQTMAADGPDPGMDPDDTLIVADQAGFSAGGSVQLYNIDVNEVAASALEGKQAIDPFVENTTIQSTFSGHYQTGADLATGVSAPAGGLVPNANFVPGTRDFVDDTNIAIILQNQGDMEITQVQEVATVNGSPSVNPEATIVGVSTQSGMSIGEGDIYVETRPNGMEAGNLVVSENVRVTNSAANITVIAGGNLTLTPGAEFQRSGLNGFEAIINTIDNELTLLDAQSVLAVGNVAFGNANAFIDLFSGDRRQDLDFRFGNAGEQSFELIIGWFLAANDLDPDIDGIDAFNPFVQLASVDPNNDTDPLLGQLSNFREQNIDFFDLDAADLVGTSITSMDQFDVVVLNQFRFFISQVTITNDVQINLFEDGGSTDLNFAQEIMPTTVIGNVVQQPSIEPVEFFVPFAAPEVVESPDIFTSVVSRTEAPIQTGNQPESFFIVKYSEDDDGVFEEEFRWDTDENLDEIRGFIEDAELVEEEFPSNKEKDSNWTERLKKGEAPPGIYYLFQVEEGKEPQQVDEPIDRTDLENIGQPSESDLEDVQPDQEGAVDEKAKTKEDPEKDDQQGENQSSENAYLNGRINFSPESELDWVQEEISDSRFSTTTQGATLGSSLLLASYFSKKESPSQPSGESTTKSSRFSLAARLKRKTERRNSNNK